MTDRRPSAKRLLQITSVIAIFALLGSGAITALVAAAANPEVAWTVTDQADTSIYGLMSIACPTSSECIAVADGSNGSVLETTDGGHTWQRQDLVPAGGDLIAYISFGVARPGPEASASL
jgi:photosystem II stability/assembly factor-like uncharacterized protein